MDMTQGGGMAPTPEMNYQPPQPPQPERRRLPAWAIPVGSALAGALVAGVGVGIYSEGKMQEWDQYASGIAAERDEAIAAPAPTVTVTRTVTVEPTLPPAPTTFDGKPEDFSIAVTVTEQKCFGSAGCNVSYRVDAPEYTGTALWPDSGTVELVYEIAGAEDTIIGSVEINTATSMVSWDDEGRTSTERADSELVATVTKVSYLDY